MLGLQEPEPDKMVNETRVVGLRLNSDDLRAELEFDLIWPLVRRRTAAFKTGSKVHSHPSVLLVCPTAAMVATVSGV
jgi:hypothetical protein|eukprot:COSAG01_NODE_3218_length_6398_cov_5.380695_3_plen_77_part_00